MKFRDPKTGEVFDDVEEALDVYVERTFDTNNPAVAARLMGYEVIEEKPYDSSRTCGICEHSKPFGIYGTVKCTKTDRYLPCEHKCDWEEVNMEKKDKPRLAELLGVDVDEEFTVVCREEGINSRPVKITAKGDFCGTGPNPVVGNMILCCAINHPESIIRFPRLTEPEIAIMRAVGAKWVSFDEINNDYVDLWENKPNCVDGRYYEIQLILAYIHRKFFPSVHPGDCICVEEVEQ